MKSVSFEVPLVPVKERPRFNRSTGKVYTPRRTRDDEETFAWHARATRTRFAGPVRVTFVFCDNRESADIDNRIKAALDAMQAGGMLENDKQVRLLHAELVDADVQSTRVTVEEIAAAEGSAA